MQTFNERWLNGSAEKQDHARTKQNVGWLRSDTKAHTRRPDHWTAGESIESFAAGFDQLVALAPHEIQVGILKRLRGTPIQRHSSDYRMRYNPSPPYNILSNDLIDFTTMQRLNRFARYWDLIRNSGRFRDTCPYCWVMPLSTLPETE